MLNKMQECADGFQFPFVFSSSAFMLTCTWQAGTLLMYFCATHPSGGTCHLGCLPYLLLTAIPPAAATAGNSRCCFFCNLHSKRQQLSW